MSWLEAVSLVEVHRETYIAILKSWIPHGKKGDFAHKVGISREYLSYLCALDHPAEGNYSTRRLPSPQMAKKIAAALPAPTEIKRSLIENMELAHINAARAYYDTRGSIAPRRVSEQLSELEGTHRQATFGTDLPEVQRAYRAVRDVAASLLPRLSPNIYPASFAQTVFTSTTLNASWIELTTRCDTQSWPDSSLKTWMSLKMASEESK